MMRHDSRNLYFLLAVMLLIGLVNPLGAADSEPNPPIKVMSFNIRYGAADDGENSWRHRSYLVLETIKAVDPDLLGTQEVLEFQADFLKKNLPGYAFHGVGRNDGVADGEFVPVMFKKDRFELLESGHFWLSETPDEPGSKSWDSSLPRMASWVRLKDLRSPKGSEVAFGNTHFDHRGVQARLESAKVIRNKIEEADPDLPIIITGDFNTTEDLEPYQALVKGKGFERPALIDTFRAIHPERTELESTMTRWTGARRGRRIDWIVHTQDIVTLDATIIYTNEDGRYPSDHYPVQALVRMR